MSSTEIIVIFRYEGKAGAADDFKFAYRTKEAAMSSILDHYRRGWVVADTYIRDRVSSEDEEC